MQVTEVSESTGPSNYRPIWFDAFLLGLGAFLVFAVTARYHDPLNNDTRASAIAAWQFAHHGNATLDAFYPHYAWLFESHGRYVTDRLPGTLFWAAPFYALLGGSGYPAIYPGALAAALASAVTVGLLFMIATHLVSRRAALVAALLLAFATGTWTVSADQLWTHGPGQAAILLAVLLASRQQWLLAGLPAGFAILIRPHLGVVAAILGVAGLVRFRKARPLEIALGSAAGVTTLLLYNRALWGRWTVFGGYHSTATASAHSVRTFAVGLAGVLVSPERGLLIMTPAIALLLAGFRHAWRVADWWVRAAAIAGLVYAVMQLWLSRFSGGDGFYSYRTTLEPLTLATPLLVLAWREWTSATRGRRTLFAALAAASVALHAFGAVINWVPSGVNLPPWKTYMPLDLARHIGTTQTIGWTAGAVIAVVAAAFFTWRRSVPTSNAPTPPPTKVALA